jgi:hypothetical protein
LIFAVPLEVQQRWWSFLAAPPLDAVVASADPLVLVTFPDWGIAAVVYGAIASTWLLFLLLSKERLAVRQVALQHWAVAVLPHESVILSHALAATPSSNG